MPILYTRSLGTVDGVATLPTKRIGRRVEPSVHKLADPARRTGGNTMSLNDDARIALASLKSKFEAKAAEFPGLKHILIEIPYPAPTQPVIPHDGSPIEKLAYDARTQGAFVAYGRLNREAAYKSLICAATLRWKLPEDEADAIIRSELDAGIQASEDYKKSPYGKAFNEVQGKSACQFVQSERRIQRFECHGHPCHIFTFADGDYDRGMKAYELLPELAENALKILAGQGLFEPTEVSPDPSEHMWPYLMNWFHVRQWMIFVHRRARERVGVWPRSESSCFLGDFRLEHGATASKLVPGVFEASSLTIERILVESVRLHAQPAAALEGTETPAPTASGNQAPPPPEAPALAAPGRKRKAPTASGTTTIGPAARAVAAALALRKEGKPVSIRAACAAAGADRKNLAAKHPESIKLIKQLGKPDRTPPKGGIDRRTKGLDAFYEPDDD